MWNESSTVGNDLCVYFGSWGTVLKNLQNFLPVLEKGENIYIKDVSGMTTLNLKKAIIGLEDYEEEDIRELLLTANERRNESEKMKLEEKRRKEQLERLEDMGLLLMENI
ncbi:hypothetical protein NPIL_703771 [Nephila pilipes]|uniref:Uncharacterized protein n=1 Tax=Nephila pilipes TaxID=299642 RepID=A0A8X6R0H6_NEPPI|nr:hypothetical protein NPIL_703771 [Nephila pilipes]